MKTMPSPVISTSSTAWVPVTERLPDPSKKVLAFYKNSLGKGRIVVAAWVPANTVQDACADDLAEYNEELDDYFWPEGWYQQIENWDEYSALTIDEGEVTHWMPLPKGPTS
jgi:hypothetical protein